MSANRRSKFNSAQSIDGPSRRAQTRAARLAITSENQLLYSREQVCHLLGGIHKATLVRYEAAGRLHAVKLNPGKQTAKTYYTREDVFALVKSLSAKSSQLQP